VLFVRLLCFPRSRSASRPNRGFESGGSEDDVMALFKDSTILWTLVVIVFQSPSGISWEC
jgi:hypothetical protein